LHQAPLPAAKSLKYHLTTCFYLFLIIPEWFLLISNQSTVNFCDRVSRSEKHTVNPQVQFPAPEIGGIAPGSPGLE
jgi:hypothetical protein